VKLTSGSGTRYGLGLSIREVAGSPAFTHGGEVSGFLTTNTILPGRRAAVVVCSNQDGINLIDSIAQTAIRTVAEGPAETSDSLMNQVRQILEGLQQGKIERTMFTSNANAYFTDQALNDYRSSLSALGPLKSIAKSAEGLRGGMTHLTFRAQFQHKSVLLNIYRTNDGKFEQYMVMEQF
jgi:D-alanyl-D-alanine carboxypeptidase